MLKWPEYWRFILTHFNASGVILQWDKIMVLRARAEVKYCLKDGGNSLPFLVAK